MIWKKCGPANYSSQQRDGSRYIITRLDGTWLIRYLPTGTLQNGGRWEAVPWTTSKRTLNTAKDSCLAHAEAHL